MNRNDLDKTLRRLAEKRVPAPPTNLAPKVWREIRRRRSRQPVPEGFFEGLVNALLRPRWALSAASMAIAVSVAFGVIEGNSSANAHVPLDLSVFSAAAPTLPSTLISQTR